MNGHSRQNGALLIARDTIVFLILMLSAVVLYRLDPKLVAGGSVPSQSAKAAVQAETTIPPAVSALSASGA